MERKWIQYRLTSNQFRDQFARMDLLAKAIVCILPPARYREGFTKALPDCDVKIIKFPSQHLSEAIVSDFDTLH